jgi:hypothetical protein
MMKNRWDRLGPLVGVAFVVLMVVDFALGGTEPRAGASAAKVVSWYGLHRSRVQVADYLMVVALVVGLLFYGYLRDRLAEDAPGLAATAFGGAVLFAVSGAVGSGAQLALADIPSRLSPAAAQALNLLNDYVAAVAVGAGAAVLMIASGLAIVKGARLPAWTGWLALVLGFVCIVPITNIGPIPAGIWTLIISIVLLRRSSEVVAAGRPSRHERSRAGRAERGSDGRAPASRAFVCCQVMTHTASSASFAPIVTV